MNIFATRNIFHFNLNFINWRYYLFTFLFVGGNLFFPWLVHNFPLGGPRFLPIYFFVLIGAYKFGWRVGVLTAIMSPVVNHFLAGMPATPMIPIILVKGIAMAVIASYIASKTTKLSLQNILYVVLGYQLVGIVCEWFYTSSIATALQDFAIGYPGLLIQLFGGFLVLSLLKDYGKEVVG